MREFWLEYIAYSTLLVLKRVFHVFWRNEYQDKSGNLPHIHGLVALYKEDMDNPEFRDTIFDLQKCSVMDLCSSDKVKDWIEEGLVENLDDWHQMHINARDFLGHVCTPRCQIRVGDGEGKENF